MLSFVILFTFIILVLQYLYNNLKRPDNFPPGPQWYPIVGNTPHLKKLQKLCGTQYKVFEKLCEHYNSPVIGLKLGNELVIFCMTYPVLYKAHTHEAFDGRPDTFFLRLRTFGTRLGITCTDGPLWSQQRSFVTRHLRLAGYGRATMEKQLQMELNEIIEILDDLKEEPVWPGQLLPANVINALWVFTAGYRIPRNDVRLRNLLKLFEKRSKAFDISGGTLNHMPWLRFIAPEKSGYNLIKQINSELKTMFMEMINEHYKNYEEHKSSDDLIYAYITEIMNQKNGTSVIDSNFNDLQLSIIILDIFIGGAQTTSTTIDLALMMMAIDPELQNKIHNEIDLVLGNEVPSLEMKNSMPYTQAFLYEIQRYFLLVKISGPRRILSETQINGYTIPKNTTVLFGIESIHKDAEYWGDAETFRPERFLSDDLKSLQNTERLMTFGLGRRKCLGEILAKACIFLYFVGILQKFKISLPNGCEKPSVELLPGIIYTPKPYKVKFTRR